LNRSGLIAACLALSAAAIAGASAREAEPPAAPVMTMRLVEGTLHGRPARWIAAQGDITWASVDSLHDVVGDDWRRIAGLPVVFHSNGGSITAAIRLARLMRYYNLDAMLGRTVERRRDQGAVEASVAFEGARCASACVYAFSGGVERMAAAGAEFEVHQFGKPADPAAPDKPVYDEEAYFSGQESAVELALVLGDHGVDPRLLRFANTAGYANVLMRLPPTIVRRMGLAVDDPLRPMRDADFGWRYDREGRWATSVGMVESRSTRDMVREAWVRCWPDEAGPMLTVKLAALNGTQDERALALAFALATTDGAVRYFPFDGQPENGPMVYAWRSQPIDAAFIAAVKRSRRLDVTFVFRGDGFRSHTAEVTVPVWDEGFAEAVAAVGACERPTAQLPSWIDEALSAARRAVEPPPR
jgi:hypothetical protein